MNDTRTRAILRKQLDASIEAIDRTRFHIADSSDARYTRPSRIVRRMVRLSRKYADANPPNVERCRYWWRWAESMAMRCGGVSGVCYTRDGYSAIVLHDGFCAHSPVPMRGEW